MRESRSQHQSTHQQPERPAQSFLVVIGRDLHPNRVNTGQEKACQEAQGQHTRKSTRPYNQQIGERACQCGNKENPGRGEAVRKCEKCKDQCTADESELHGRGDVADGSGLDIECFLQLRHHRIAGKPEGSTRKLRDDDDRQDGIGSRG